MPQQAWTAIEEGDQCVDDLLQWTVEIAVWLGIQPFFVAEQAFLQDTFVVWNAVDPAVAADGIALRHKTHDGEGDFIDGAFQKRSVKRCHVLYGFVQFCAVDGKTAIVIVINDFITI